jgi:hypothetical protein
VYVTPKSTIGKAFTYAQNQWSTLMPLFQDGRLLIDNNHIENKIRPLALGRKNYLFAGGHEAAQRAAMMYSFMAIPTTKWFGMPNHFESSIYSREKGGRSPNLFGSGIVARSTGSILTNGLRTPWIVCRIPNSRSSMTCCPDPSGNPGVKTRSCSDAYSL